MAEARAPSVTHDAFYGGRLHLAQPAQGHRSGTDAVLLAAAVAAGSRGLVYDIGSGVGAAGLGVALRCQRTRVVLVERDAAIAALAELNVGVNALADRVSVAVCDINDRDFRRRALPDAADLIITNPPFHAADATRASPDAGRRSAHVLAEGSTLADWILACLDMLAAKGTLIVVHAASARPAILAAFDRRLGAITILAVHPRGGEAARRVLVRGVKGSRAPLTIAAPLVLHDGAGFSTKAERLHQGEAHLDW